MAGDQLTGGVRSSCSRQRLASMYSPAFNIGNPGFPQDNRSGPGFGRKDRHGSGTGHGLALLKLVSETKLSDSWSVVNLISKHYYIFEGTGKSYAMKRRVARLLEEQVPPRQGAGRHVHSGRRAEDLHRELQKLDVPGCEGSWRAKPSMGWPCAYFSRQHVLNSVGRHPRPLNNFEQKAMYSDIGPSNGGITACKDLVQAYEGAWARARAISRASRRPTRRKLVRRS